MSVMGVFFFLVVGLVCAFGDASYTIDMSATTKPIWSFWETSTTFDHGYQALREDWRDSLLETHQDIGIQYVRFHETFDNDIGIVNPKLDPHDESAWSYINIDKIYDYLLSIGMKPYIELDMMPSTFVPSYQISKMYDRPVFTGPPSNLTLWSNFIKSFITHLTDRYGSSEVSKWYFEAWNEPQCSDNWYNQNLTTFENTWKVTAAAIKSVNKSYKIGGPATCGTGWIPQFPQWCMDNNINMDFISTHSYPIDGGCAQTHNGYYQHLQQLSETIKKINPNWNIHITAYGVTYGKYGDVGHHDTSYNAAGFVTFASQFQKLDSNQFDIMSFTGFSDLWDQSGIYSQPFHNGYGWSTNRGIHKPTYRILELLHKYATNRYYFDNVNIYDNVTTIQVFPTINSNKNEIVLFVANWMLPNKHIINETVIIKIINIDSTTILPEYATIMRIDYDNTNPAEIWQSIGSPIYPIQQQLDILIEASEIVPKTMKIDSTDTSVTINVDVPIYGIAVIVVQIN